MVVPAARVVIADIIMVEAVVEPVVVEIVPPIQKLETVEQDI